MPPAGTTPPPTPPTARWPPGPRSAPRAYLRGDQERGGDITGYAEGLRRAGVTNLDYATVPGSGHFPHEEAPDLLWDLIATFAGLTG
jgi:pimeloyl-ACP methyl ester carboxylesterase